MCLQHMEISHDRGKSSKIHSDERNSSNYVCDDDDTGTRRPYKCTFCRRGFSSAQALGGHMNIHRRERSKIRQPPPKPEMNQASEDCEYYVQQHQSHGPVVYLPANEPSVVPIHGMNLASGSSSSTSAIMSAAAISAEIPGVLPWERRTELKMFGEDLLLGLEARWDGKREDEGRRLQREEDGGLDLELRLGHEP